MENLRGKKPQNILATGDIVKKQCNNKGEGEYGIIKQFPENTGKKPMRLTKRTGKMKRNSA